MDMVWKRLHDNGKNWRHVYKALMLSEYLLKTGPSHVVAEIQKNVHAFTMLTTFQYTSPKSGVDKGVNVREHAKACLTLVQNEAVLRREREVGVRNHQRYTEVMGDQARAKAGSKQKSGAPTASAGLDTVPPPDQYGAGAGAGAGGPSNALNMQEQRILAEHQATMVAQRDQTAAMAALSDTGTGAPQTEEQMIALAIRMSAMEASQRGEYAPTAEELEQTQLAVALSLSMADSDRAALGGDSSGESDDELTPPSSPYHGQFFNTPGDQPSPYPGAVGGPALPSYDEALVDEPQFTALSQPGVPHSGTHGGFLPSAPGGYDPSTHTIDIGSPEAAAAGMAELESYLQGPPTTPGVP